jgi:type II secretory ATPase GspE/PulE/Tfp pilus assembly ATPase PilB-like protein
VKLSLAGESLDLDCESVPTPLGRLLVEEALVTEDELGSALLRQRALSPDGGGRHVPLGKVLLGMGLVDEHALLPVLARKLGIQRLALGRLLIDPAALALVPGELASRLAAMPLQLHGGGLVVALANPLDREAIEKLRFVSQRRIVPAFADRSEIIACIASHYGEGGGRQAGRVEPQIWTSALQFVSASEARPAAAQGAAAPEPRPEPDDSAVVLVNRLITDASRLGASDIHIECYPEGQASRVRIRRDGTLIEHGEIPAAIRDSVVSRIKVMAQLDISEHRKPQDGKLTFVPGDSPPRELRVATIPTVDGMEDVVMRVPSAARILPMGALGLAPDSLLALQRMVERPYGLILVCGPTGSGKTTTLHSLVGHINTADRKIWTAEDPVEITQPGLRQVQVNARIGWGFAGAIRSFLRADPDVIMVGEMRDRETAKIVIEGSLTGHLVLSTLHTNSAPESVVRLLDLGMDSFNFADALLGILAQRLVKSLCAACKKAYAPDAAELHALALEYCEGTGGDPAALRQRWEREAPAGLRLYRAKGCRACLHSGYRGRFGLHELLTATPAIKKMIQMRAPVSELAAAAREGGMRTLKQDGIGKVLQGLTDMAQVRSLCV